MITALYTKVTKGGPIDGEEHSTQGFLFFPSSSVLLQPPLAYVN
jgi:hypothetical protein